jgi:hypothetical protein
MKVLEGKERYKILGQLLEHARQDYHTSIKQFGRSFHQNMTEKEYMTQAVNDDFYNSAVFIKYEYKGKIYIMWLDEEDIGISREHILADIQALTYEVDKDLNIINP